MIQISSCVFSLPLAPLSSSAPKFFGFSEFLAGLALMVLAWSIADIRYRFRIATAPIPLKPISFWVIFVVGICALVTDVARADQWLVPTCSWMTLSIWQGILGGIFFLTILSWFWFAFIHPPQFGKYTATRYASVLYSVVLKGDPSELAVISEELGRSVEPILSFATSKEDYRSTLGSAQETKAQREVVASALANDILLLIADKRFCRAMVGSSPGTALEIFRQIKRTGKYRVPVEIFSKNLITEALANRDSFVFHEGSGYSSGLIGLHRPLSEAMFSDYHLTEEIGTLLDPDVEERWKWDSAQWEAYCRLVSITIDSVLNSGERRLPHCVCRAFDNLEHAVFDLHKLEGLSETKWGSEPAKNLGVLVSFVKRTVRTIGSRSPGPGMALRMPDEDDEMSLHNQLARFVVRLITAAADVKSPRAQCWNIQHNAVWGELFNFNNLDTPAGRAIKHKVRRLLFEEIKKMDKWPNYRGARIVAFCLNVMGLSQSTQQADKDSQALHRVVLSWVHQHFASLYDSHRNVAEACLVEGFTYDPQKFQLVRQNLYTDVTGQPPVTIFQVLPIPLKPEGL